MTTRYINTPRQAIEAALELFRPDTLGADYDQDVRRKLRTLLDRIPEEPPGTSRVEEPGQSDTNALLALLREGEQFWKHRSPWCRVSMMCNCGLGSWIHRIHAEVEKLNRAAAPPVESEQAGGSERVPHDEHQWATNGIGETHCILCGVTSEPPAPAQSQAADVVSAADPSETGELRRIFMKARREGATQSQAAEVAERMRRVIASQHVFSLSDLIADALPFVEAAARAQDVESELHEIRCLLMEYGWDARGSASDRVRLELRRSVARLAGGK